MKLTSSHLADLTQPVQLIWGEDEPAGARQLAERAARTIPLSELHMIPAGHLPWLNRPHHVAKLISPFLRG